MGRVRYATNGADGCVCSAVTLRWRHCQQLSAMGCGTSCEVSVGCTALTLRLSGKEQRWHLPSRGCNLDDPGSVVADCPNL